jgi:hypothetical protein
MPLRDNVGLKVVELSLFPHFVDGMRWFLVQGNTGMFPGRRATTTCGSFLLAGLFIDSQKPHWRWYFFASDMVEI